MFVFVFDCCSFFCCFFLGAAQLFGCLVVRGWWLVVVFCLSLAVACWLLVVVCCLLDLDVGGVLLFVVRCVLIVGCRLLVVGYLSLSC